MSLSLQQIEQRLSEIENDLAERQGPYSKAAENVIRLSREFELRLVRGKFAVKADTQTEKKDRALEAIAAADDDLYERWVEAEATYEGQRAAIKVLETRATIGMSLKKNPAERGG